MVLLSELRRRMLDKIIGSITKKKSLLTILIMELRRPSKLQLLELSSLLSLGKLKPDAFFGVSISPEINMSTFVCGAAIEPLVCSIILTPRLPLFGLWLKG